MHSHFLSFQKRTISICCACILLAMLIVGVLPFMTFPAAAAEVVSTGSCGDNLTYTLTDDGVLTISGTGAMTDFSSSSALPWVDYEKSITSVVIESGVTSIGSYAFFGCSAVVSIDIADTVQKLGKYSFYSCGALLSVNIPFGVVDIPDSCFSLCSSLIAISLPNGLQTIGNSAFYNCAFTSIDLPESLVSFGSDAFAFSNLMSFTIPANVTSIGNYPFRECYNLSEIVFLPSTPPTYNSSYKLIDNYTPVEVLWVPVGALETYKASASFSNYRAMFAEIGSDLVRNCVNMQDFYVSSSQTDNVLTEVYEIANGGFYKSSLSYIVTYLDDVTSAYKNTGLPWFQQSFYIADIADVAYDYTLSCSFTYMTTAASPYSSDGYEFTVFFYDVDGNLLASHYSGKTSCKLPAGTNTLTKTYSGVFPEGAVYMGIYYEIGSFRSTAMPTNMSANMMLSVNSEPPVLPVSPAVSSNYSPSYSYTVGAAAGQLSVNASITDDGVLSYQWYENTTNSTSGGTAISGATSASYTPSTSEVGTKYYYCAVTNTLGEYTSTVYSDVTCVSVSKPVAGAPTVTSNFASSYDYLVGQFPSELSVTASAADDGVLSYQWYLNTTNSTSGGTAIDGATAASFSPPPAAAGTYYYYCIVTNTLGDSVTTAASKVAVITFTKPVAGKPTVVSNFASSYEYKLGDTASSVSVSATVSDAGTLSYQWYILDPYDGDIEQPIPGAIYSTYVPVLDYVGSRYYCCVVTNTLGDSTAESESEWFLITCIAATQMLEAGQWEAKTNIMTGEYLPLDVWPDELGAVDLMFSVSGVKCSKMSYQFDLLSSRGYGIYYDGTMAYSYGFAAQEQGFISGAYALVFLEADQEVPTEFYGWFTSCFEYVGKDEQIPVYHTTINIYDNTGATLLDSFDTYGDGVSPTLYCSITGDGFSLIYGTGFTWSWATDSEVFFGFATTPDTTVAWWVPGESFEAGGSPSNFTVSLYVVDSSGVSVDEEYQDASLNWFERLYNRITSGFQNLAGSMTGGFGSVVEALAPSEAEKQLSIIDFTSVGEFFKQAYENLSSLFGLRDLIYGEDSAFAWLIEE